MFAKFLSCLIVLLSFSLPATAAEKRVLVFGDSLSAGFGIAVGESWPALLERRLQGTRTGYDVANASISGETTAGGRARFVAAMAHFRPDVVILALGANDGLRGLPVRSMKDNLAFMLAHARERGARALLVGMRLPPNYGAGYTREFEAAFRDLARSEKVRLLPFLLEPIALDRNAYQPDGLHPTAAAQPKILDHVWKALKPLLTS